MKNFCIFCAVFILSSCGSCSPDSAACEEGSYSFLSYNLCNLFDDVRDGTEYAEFDPSGGRWTSAHYLGKLNAVGRVIAESVSGGPDFAAFVEIENDKALAGLAAGPLYDMAYRWGATLPTEGSAIRVGFLSRLPVTDIRGHMPPSSGFHQRAFLEVVLDVDGEVLTVFICHFKAKTEGEAATENSRRLAADTLVRRINELAADSPGCRILVLGDLNENIDEYERKNGAYVTALMPASAADSAARFAAPAAGDLLPLYVSGEKARASAAGQVVFYSPWLDDPPFPGSYYYRGWETIDHALVSQGLAGAAGLVFDSFAVIRSEYMLTASGTPKKEYSDHLPLLVRLVKR
jgi:endonuclease/exonuclease/phosphatase family metal-dependent hydrolase